MYCSPCFTLSETVVSQLYKRTPSFGFNGFGEVVYYRTYSRLKDDGGRESWADTIVRVVNGIFSIRKDYYKKHVLHWDEPKMQELAAEMADYIFSMRFTPPGRGLWACGTPFMYERGSMALNNCAAVDITELNSSLPWIMDCLMCGVGVGFRISWKADVKRGINTLVHPPKEKSTFVIEDSREGWVDSIRVLIEAYLPSNVERQPLLTQNNGYDRTKYPVFDYSQLRPKGTPIKGFGGLASGSEPLEKLHWRYMVYFNAYMDYIAHCLSSWLNFVQRLITKLKISKIYQPKNNHLKTLIDKTTLNNIQDLTNDPDYLEFLSFIESDAKLVLLWKDYQNKHPNIGRHSMLTGMAELDAYIVLRRHKKVNRSFSLNGSYIKQYKRLIKDFLEEENLPKSECQNVLYGSKSLTTFMQKYDLSVEDQLYSPEWSTHFQILDKLTVDSEYDDTRLIADLVNNIGVCVVSGNVRRSAEIAVASITDDTFRDLKNYQKFPERELVGWMSNNSGLFEKSSDFKEYIPKIVDNIFDKGEPGMVNMINIRNFGRVNPHESSKHNRESEPDFARLTNPCGEIPLESYELCNLVEVFPTRCVDDNNKFNLDIFHKALKLATFYSSTVALLPTHYPSTNSVIARNRRIGVSLSGVALFYENESMAGVIRYFRDGYSIVRETNIKLAKEAGVVESIRVSTIKPSGTVSLLAGVPPGMHFPLFRYAIRRIRIAENSPIAKILTNNQIYHEKDLYSENTLVFEFPIDHGNIRPSGDISHWEQFSILSMLQREWSDNMVSATITFDKKKVSPLELEKAIAAFAPTIKSCSLLPHSDEGAYKQMPYEGITKEKYDNLCAKLKTIDWTILTESQLDNEMPKYCDSANCLL